MGNINPFKDLPIDPVELKGHLTSLHDIDNALCEILESQDLMVATHDLCHTSWRFSPGCFHVHDT